MTEPRPKTFRFKDWLQLMMLMAGVMTLVSGIIGWSFLRWSEWRDVPERLGNLEVQQQAIMNQIGASRPAVIHFSGGGIVAQATTAPGGSIAVTYVLRRTIDCATEIHVRFFDHSRNIIAGAYSYTIPAIRSPVSSDYSSFTVPVRIPDNLPAGTYSYFPEIVPQNCGVYGPIVAPMSETFTVS